jgi:acetolactate synthase-1/2/3 large subunit
MEVGMPDFGKLAEAFGIKGILVTERSQLAPAVAEMLAYDGPVLLDVRVRRDENCYPMVAPGKSNAQMLGLPEVKRETPVSHQTCANCQTDNHPSHQFCSHCGAKL